MLDFMVDFYFFFIAEKCLLAQFPVLGDKLLWVADSREI